MTQPKKKKGKGKAMGRNRIDWGVEGLFGEWKVIPMVVGFSDMGLDSLCLEWLSWSTFLDPKEACAQSYSISFFNIKVTSFMEPSINTKYNFYWVSQKKKKI